jgi:hypothetical protein
MCCSLLYHLLLVQNVYDSQCASVHWLFFSKKRSLFYYLLLVENCSDFWHANIWMLGCLFMVKNIPCFIVYYCLKVFIVFYVKTFIVYFLSSWNHFLFYYLLLAKGVHGFLCVNICYCCFSFIFFVIWSVPCYIAYYWLKVIAVFYI